MMILLKILVMAPPLMLAVILHEIAHGYVALKLGDPTARSQGRLTLNPLKHIDPFMTIILPALLIFSGSPVVFGGAKPVPINPGYFANPRKGMMWVALAGPITNITLALLSYLLFSLLVAAHAQVPVNILNYIWISWMMYSIPINLVLAVFNLIPIPPLDGGRVAVGILPIALARPLARLERYGMLIIFALLYFGVLDSILTPIITALAHMLPNFPL